MLGSTTSQNLGFILLAWYASKANVIGAMMLGRTLPSASKYPMTLPTASYVFDSNAMEKLKMVKVNT